MLDNYFNELNKREQQAYLYGRSEYEVEIVKWLNTKYDEITQETKLGVSAEVVLNNFMASLSDKIQIEVWEGQNKKQLMEEMKMKSELFEIVNLKDDMEILQEKFDDLIQSNRWLIEDHFEADRLKSNDEMMKHGVGYYEQRIRLTQSQKLLEVYQKEMDELILKLDSELNKLNEEGA